jgi:hypothetical protein
VATKVTDVGLRAQLHPARCSVGFMSGGRHGFTSISGMQAQHFDVVVDEHYPDDALGRLDVADPNPSEVHHELKGA